MKLKDKDRELVEKILSGNSQAFTLFYKDNYKKVYSFVSSRISDKNTAEEITQDIFIDFLDSLRDFRFQSKLNTFLYSISRNKVIDYIRKKKVKQVFISHIPSFIAEGLLTVNAVTKLEQKELEAKIEKILKSMPHDYEVVLRLKYIEGESVQNIAIILAKTFKSTESLIYRARMLFINRYNKL